MPANQIKNLAVSVYELLQGNGSYNSLELALEDLLKIYPNILEEEEETEELILI